MAKMRHWKQRFVPGAKLVFRKRMVLNCCGVETVQPGDPVTDEMMEHFGRRLRVWWEANVLELAPEAAPEKAKPKPTVVPPEAPEPAPDAEPKPTAKRKKAPRKKTS